MAGKNSDPPAHPGAIPNLLNIEPLHSSLVYLKPAKPYDARVNDLSRFDEEPFNLFQLSFMHFSEQFFNRTKAEKNFQNIQRAALLILVIGRGLRAIELVRWHHAKLLDVSRPEVTVRDSKDAQGENKEQRHLSAIAGCVK